MRFGDFELRLVNGGNFRLDGGAMHGVVPKTIWERLVSCDDKNRCAYATNCLLVENRVTGQRTRARSGLLASPLKQRVGRVGVAQLGQRFLFDLPNPLAGQADVLTDLVEGVRTTAHQPEP